MNDGLLSQLANRIACKNTANSALAKDDRGGTGRQNLALKFFRDFGNCSLHCDDFCPTTLSQMAEDRSATTPAYRLQVTRAQDYTTHFIGHIRAREREAIALEITSTVQFSEMPVITDRLEDKFETEPKQHPEKKLPELNGRAEVPSTLS